MDGAYQPNAVGRGGWVFTHDGDNTWTDYTYRVSYDTEMRAGGYLDHHMVLIYFHVAGEDTYLLWVWDPGNAKEGGSCPDWSKGAVGLSRYTNGTGVDLTETCRSNTTVGTNRLVVNITSNNIKVKINGQVIPRYTDQNPIPYGGVGVGQVWETNGWYDDVVVTRSTSVAAERDAEAEAERD
jgi:hypothetical protein